LSQFHLLHYLAPLTFAILLARLSNPLKQHKISNICDHLFSRRHEGREISHTKKYVFYSSPVTVNPSRQSRNALLSTLSVSPYVNWTCQPIQY